MLDGRRLIYGDPPFARADCRDIKMRPVNRGVESLDTEARRSRQSAFLDLDMIDRQVFVSPNCYDGICKFLNRIGIALQNECASTGCIKSNALQRIDLSPVLCRIFFF